MGTNHRGRVSGVGTNGRLSGNHLSVDNQVNGVTAAGIKRRDLVQSDTQAGIQFLQRAVEEDQSDSDTGSSLLDDLDLHGEDQDTSDRRIRAEAKSIRKVITSVVFWLILFLMIFTPCRLKDRRAHV